MFIKELKCSNCGSNDFKEISENKFSCTYCGTLNYIHKPEQKKEFTYNRTTYTYTFESTSTQSRAWMFANLGVIFSLCLTIGITVILSNSTYDPDDFSNIGFDKPKEIEINGVKYLDTLTIKVDHPDIKVAWYEMSDTGSFKRWRNVLIVGEVENKSGAVWKYPFIEFNFYKDGLKVASVNDKLDIGYILPKSKESFCLNWSFGKPFDSLEIVNKCEPFFFNSPKKSFAYKIKDEKFSIGSRDDAILEGVLENPNNHSINISGFVKFYDASGKYVGKNNLYSGILRKGEKTKFSISARFIKKGVENPSPALMREPKSYKYFLKADSIPG